MLTHEDLLKRKKGIGGSDVGAIFGMSKWKTPLEIYMDKINPEVEKEEPKIWHTIGHQVEEHILIPYYEKKHGVKILKPESKFSKKHPFMIGNIDGITEDGNTLIECKNVGGFKNTDEWGKEGSDKVPYVYYLQCAHYMEVFDVDETHLIVLFGGNKIEEFVIKRDSELSDTIIEKEKAFWEEHVLAKNPPSATSRMDLKILFPYAKEKTSIQATPEIMIEMMDIRVLEDEKKNIQRTIEQKQVGVQEFMRENDILESADNSTLATWKNQKYKDTTIRAFRINRKIFN